MDAILKASLPKLREKLLEALQAVLPIAAIVLVLCFTIAPVSPSILLCFLLGAAMIVVGIMFFTLGAEMSMTPMGERIGTRIAQSKRLPVIIGLCFVLGFIITISEPDLQVLAGQVPSVSNMTLILAVAVGVGIFLVAAVLRMLFSKPLSYMLLIFYPVVFILTFFVSKDFLAIAFDSGGVTTGPMTVPFILAMGLGVSMIRSDRSAEADSFGLVALCSIGPILSVLILGFFYNDSEATAGVSAAAFADTREIGSAFISAIPEYMAEMAVALLPIVAIFLIFQLCLLRLHGRPLAKILIGIVYTYVGLVLFLTGVNVGFSPLGAELGAELAESGAKWLLIPLSMLLGWFIISAEPAVGVLEKQIEQVSAGAIPGRAIKLSLSIAIALAMGIAMLRVVTGISIMWFLVPGYAIALGLSFFVPDIYTAIAFDSGGVASGPMTATFMLQFMMGASTALGGNVLSDAFGVVAIVAMMPLLSIQVVGVLFEKHAKRSEANEEVYGDLDIIELWEEAI